MSDFSDFMTMKIIEWRRAIKGGFSNKEFEVQFLEQMNAVKNLNVRAPISTIAQIETLAQWTGVSKAELVLEMLSSCIADAYDMMEKEGNADSFQDDLFTHMEKNYAVILKRDENGKVCSFDYPELDKQVSDS